MQQLCVLGRPSKAIGVTECECVCSGVTSWNTWGDQMWVCVFWGDQLKHLGWPNVNRCSGVTSWNTWGDQMWMCILGWPVETLGVTKCECVFWGDQLKHLGWPNVNVCSGVTSWTIGVTKCECVYWGDQLKQLGWPNVSVCAGVTSWNTWGDQMWVCILGWPVLLAS